MNNELKQTIKAVKLAKGTNRLQLLAKEYGTMDNALNALDCRSGSIAERMAEKAEKFSRELKKQSL